MNGRFLAVAAVAGGITLFIWGAVANSVAAGVFGTLGEFRDSAAVTAAVRDNTQGNGVYLAEEGLLVAVDLRADGRARAATLGPFMLTELVSDMFVALLLALLLLRTAAATLKQRVTILGLAALAAGLAGPISDWNWYGFSTPYTVAALLETIIGWKLAGAVISLLMDRMLNARA